ncbi:hypothetical protein [Noviherbaspirillum sedimenti]|uniref:hypothetical protein n=1 Tax=Noviherbaspirillum sedimenti TaxID=2320865 RepID=UPI0018F27DE3|nr:hypothetical protein [Noviherbaspirillum sedimenti]
MTTNRLLPEGFENLEPFVGYWVRDTNNERWKQRSLASMEDIRSFYDAMLARAEDAITHLDKFPLDQMPEDAERLFKLLLAIAHAAMAVEIHGQPRARNAKLRNDLNVTQGPWPFGGVRNGGDHQKTIGNKEVG